MKDEEDIIPEVIAPETNEEAVNTWKVVEENSEIHQSFITPEVIEEDPKEDLVVDTIIEDTKSEVVEETKPTITDDLVLSYLNEKGFDAKNLDDLKPKEIQKLDAETEKYLEYKKETNGSYSDFLQTQKDWSTESKENILLQNLKLENPTLTEKQIERLFQREYGVSEFADDDEITDKEINIERDYQKGLKLLENNKEKYMVRRGSDESIPEEFRKAKELVDNSIKQQEENEIILEQLRNDFQEKTNQVFTKDFEGFKGKVGDEEYSIKPENVEETKKTLSVLSNFDKKFFDEQGKLKDAQGYYKALYFAMNPDKVADHFTKIGMAKQLEIEEKESKNIVVQGNTNIQTGQKITPWKVTEE